MATLHLMVGLPCSGKTTLARTLEQKYSALRLTPDEWQLRLFGQDAADPQHDARHSLIESLQWEVAERALALGTNVILDFGFWTRAEREDFRSRAEQLGARSEVHFLDVPSNELLRRLAYRNAQPRLAFRIPEEMMRSWIESFQKPAPDELQPRNQPSRPFVIHEEECEVEGASDGPFGSLRWRTLVSGDRTPSDSLTVGIAELEPGASEKLTPHSHAQAEVYHILSGRGTVTISGVEHPLRPGSTVFIPGGAEHGARNTGADLLRLLYVFPANAFSDIEYEFPGS